MSCWEGPLGKSKCEFILLLACCTGHHSWLHLLEVVFSLFCSYWWVKLSQRRLRLACWELSSLVSDWFENISIVLYISLRFLFSLSRSGYKVRGEFQFIFVTWVVTVEMNNSFGFLKEVPTGYNNTSCHSEKIDFNYLSSCQGLFYGNHIHHTFIATFFA